MRRGAIAPIFNLSAHLLNVNSACQLCIADKTQGRCYLLSNWARIKSVSRKIGVVHPTNNVL